MAIIHAPRAARTAGRKAISSVARGHIAEAKRVLYDDAPGLHGDEALAQRERYRCEEEARSAGQGVLPLDLSPSPPEGASRSPRADARSLNLNHEEVIQVPNDGSSPSMGPAGNSDPVFSVDSDAGSY